jgi:hypothetical protein
MSNIFSETRPSFRRTQRLLAAGSRRVLRNGASLEEGIGLTGCRSRSFSTISRLTRIALILAPLGTRHLGDLHQLRWVLAGIAGVAILLLSVGHCFAQIVE